MVSTKKIKINIRNKQASFLFSQTKKTNEQLFKDFCSSPQGLSLTNVKEKYDQYGYNILANKSKKTWYKTLLSSFFNIFSWILIVIAILNVTISRDNRDWCSFTILMIIFFVAGILKFIQEFKANNAMQKLNKTIKTTASILRENIKSEIPIGEIVPGDIIYLAAGDMIPCDMRLLYTKDLFITQSIISGESEPVEKISQPITQNITNVLNCNNICYMGTTVASGSAYGIAIQTGKNTFLGKIATIIAGKRPKTNFDKGIKKVGIIIVETMSLMSVIIFLIYGLIAHEGIMQSWIKALIFSLSVAISIIPEMLPMIVTLNLAKEAIKFSRQKAIVKNINSIQTFGAMNILCTDKTGTLTEDHIILQKYLNVMGNEDDNVLLYGCLNSYYQTGLKNLIDKAIIEHTKRKEIWKYIFDYQKVDEVPFDFERRRMSIILQNKNNGERKLITKGASEEILKICSKIFINGQVKNLTTIDNERIRKKIFDLNECGMRVICVATNYQKLLKNEAFNDEDESDLMLVGYIALLDPPKLSAKKAINDLLNKGVEIKILTGDNEKVTKYICKELNVTIKDVLLGDDIEKMSFSELKERANDTTIFAKLNPEQKSLIVKALKTNNHVVGFMGDGINDTPAMKESDIAISVDSAVDIAKETADIVLLEKDLSILGKGIIQGRKTFANIIKYIKLVISGNFGNMLSILIGICWLNFAPLTTIQILLLNIIFDFSQLAIPWDNVDVEFLQKPKNWSAKSILKFMLVFGPISTIFDLITFVILFFHFKFNGATNESIDKFHTCWFIQSIATQVLTNWVLRSRKIAFIQTHPSKIVIWATIVLLAFCCVLPFIPYVNVNLNFIDLSKHQDFLTNFWWILIVIEIFYVFFLEVIKKIYLKINHNQWL